MRIHGFASVVAASVVAVILLATSSCASGGKQINKEKMREFALSYTQAWSSQNPESVASHFAENGSLQINENPPSVGRIELTETAKSFMTQIPDLALTMDDLSINGDGFIYRWTLRGTNSGPDGNGNSVEISGFEEWTMSREGLILESKGHMDLDDYQRQLSAVAP